MLRSKYQELMVKRPSGPLEAGEARPGCSAALMSGAMAGMLRSAPPWPSLGSELSAAKEAARLGTSTRESRTRTTPVPIGLNLRGGAAARKNWGAVRAGRARGAGMTQRAQQMATPPCTHIDSSTGWSLGHSV